MSSIVLLSGGLDSSVALHHAHQHWGVHTALSFDYGSKHNQRELQHAAWQSQSLNIEHKIIQLPFINQHFKSSLLQSGAPIQDGKYDQQNLKQTVVPFRNAILLSIATGIAESQQCQHLVIAAHSGDHPIYPDCREDFMHAMSQAIHSGTDNQIQLQRPFIQFDKSQIVQRGQQLKVNFSQTYSCYRGGQQHCGQCSTCLDRRQAFQQAQIPDPTNYQSKATNRQHQD